MQHLTPVGLSEDGENLVLVSDAGEEFTVRVDHRFRTALRGDNARLGQLEMKMESALRPRDIQARIRAGESAEDVAAAAQTTVEAIMPFAGPVLAERAHVAQTALKASIRRRTNETTPGARTLDEASRRHFSTVGVRADDVIWDAWRRDDGRWTLLAVYVVRGTEHRATFTYDQPGRYVLAEDDGSRVLTGEAGPVAESTPSAAAAPRHLSALSSEDELPLGDDAIELVRGPQPVEPIAELPLETSPDEPAEAPLAEEPAPHSDTTDLTATAAAVREAAFDDIVEDHADADWIAELPLESAPDEPVETPADVEPVETPDETPVETPAETPAEEPAEEPVAIADEPAPEKPRKKGRSSVPSWDEIMFGGGGRD